MKNCYYFLCFIICSFISCSKQSATTSQKLTNLKAYEGDYSSSLVITKTQTLDLTLKVIDENTVEFNFKGANIPYNLIDNTVFNCDFKVNGNATEYPTVGSTGFAVNIPESKMNFAIPKYGSIAFSLSGTYQFTAGSVIGANQFTLIQKPVQFVGYIFSKK